MKNNFNMMLDYAVEYELVGSNCARQLSLDSILKNETKEETKSHIAFTDNEMDLLWNNVENIKHVDLLLIQCYSGWRPNELLGLELKNVDIENWTFTGGLKTANGKNRIVPIHKKIRVLVKKYYDRSISFGSNLLFTNTNGKSIPYVTYQKGLYAVIDKLHLSKEHRLHDCRKHFITIAKKYNVDEYAIKRFVGHTINDLTEKVYTERSIEWLTNEMAKIK